MKSLKEQVLKELSEPIHGHSSREPEQKIKRLEMLAVLMAEKIDKIYQEGFEQGYDNALEDRANES